MPLRAFLLLALAALATAAGGSAVHVSLAAPATAVAGVPVQITVRVDPAPPVQRLTVTASAGSLRRTAVATRSGGVYRSSLALPLSGRWTLAVRVGGRLVTRTVRVSPPPVRHPYAVAAGPRGVAFVADGTSRRVLRLDVGSRRLSVHASGFVEPTGVAYGSGNVYVADFGAGAVRRIDASGKVVTIARHPEVASVAVAGSTVYAVAFDGTLARISPGGRVERISVQGGLARPHGVSVDRDGSLLVTEDGRRVSRVDPATGAKEVVEEGRVAHRVAIAGDGTLFVAGSTVSRGSLRRLSSGETTTLLDDLRVSDVAVVAPGTLLVTAVEPGSLWRVDARTGSRTRVVGR